VVQVGPDGESRCWRVERDQAGDCRAGLAPLGWAPAAAAIPLPAGLSQRDAMALGTAGPLAGIDAATLPSQDDRRRLWARLAELWPRVRGSLPVTVLPLDEVGRQAARMLAGETIGRAAVVP
jgi:NADPH:quinone reductase-like Zn-dependent oxidoreductase